MEITPLRRSIIHTLAYYDIFSYPLTAEEVYYNLNTNHTSVSDVKNELDLLTRQKIIFNKNGYFLLKDDEYYINRRKSGNALAKKRLKAARLITKLISRFPFVRGVMLSGSISKGFMEKDSDIDFFLVTHPNRLWLTRLILMLFKKIFLLNSRKYFCINYYIDVDNLEIKEKNIFTAIELSSLIPTFGSAVYNGLYKSNGWIKNFYPNFPKRELDQVIDRKNGFIKSFIEKLLSKKLGDKIDDFSMRMFNNYNQKKYGNFNNEDFKLAFKSNKSESKHHPKFFQKKVLEEFNKKVKLIEEQLYIVSN